MQNFQKLFKQSQHLVKLASRLVVIAVYTKTHKKMSVSSKITCILVTYLSFTIINDIIIIMRIKNCKFGFEKIFTFTRLLLVSCSFQSKDKKTAAVTRYSHLNNQDMHSNAHSKFASFSYS